jgi:tetratricopeptide (TPR) repeat protein
MRRFCGSHQVWSHAAPLRFFSVTRPKIELSKVAKIGGEESESLFQRGLSLLEAGELAAARQALSDGISVDPTDVRLFAARASCLERQDRLDEALLDYETVTKLMPDSPPAHVAHAVCLRRVGRSADAERVLDHLLAAVGEYGPALVAKGEIQLESERLSQAEASFRAAIRRDEGDAMAMSGLAQTLLRLEKLDDCEKVLRKLLQTSPDEGRDWSALGNVLYQKERFAEAVDAFSRAISLSGEVEFHVQRAAACLQLHKPDEALSDLLFVAKEDSEGEATHISNLMFGLAYYEKKDLRKAGQHFRLWLKNAGQDEDLAHVHSILLKTIECSENEEEKKSLAQRAKEIGVKK